MSASVTAVEFLRKTLGYPDWRGKILYGILRGAFACIPIRRRLVLDSLKASFPEKDETWRRGILRGMYSHFSWMLVEILAAVNDTSLVNKMVVEVHGKEIVDRFKIEKQGCFMLTAHFGNWEIGGSWFCQNDYPMMPAARDTDDEGFAALVESYRSILGEKTIRKGAKNVRQMVKSALDGWIIALLSDQDAGRDGTPVTFLGRRTTMVNGPAALSLTAKVPLITAYSLRLAPFKYKIFILPPIATGQEGRCSENIAELTRKANAVLEDMVRLAPEQWFWFHRRWKYDPDHPGVKAQ